MHTMATRHVLASSPDENSRSADSGGESWGAGEQEIRLEQTAWKQIAESRLWGTAARNSFGYSQRFVLIFSGEDEDEDEVEYEIWNTKK